MKLPSIYVEITGSYQFTEVDAVLYVDWFQLVSDYFMPRD